MGDIEWKDTSARRQGATAEEQGIAKEWTVEVGDLRLCIHHYIGMGDVWFLSCHQIYRHRMDLMTEDVDQAKKKAVSMVLGQAERYFQDAKALYDELS